MGETNKSLVVVLNFRELDAAAPCSSTAKRASTHAVNKNPIQARRRPAYSWTGPHGRKNSHCRFEPRNTSYFVFQNECRNHSKYDPNFDTLDSEYICVHVRVARDEAMVQRALKVGCCFDSDEIARARAESKLSCLVDLRPKLQVRT